MNPVIDTNESPVGAIVVAITCYMPDSVPFIQEVDEVKYDPFMPS